MEFEAHLAHRVDDLVAEGMSEAEARATALREFGDTDRLREESRAARAEGRRRAGPPSRLAGLGQDLRFAVRQLRRAPGFALAALATLALGIGGTTTIVSVVSAVVLEPLPFRAPDRIVFAEMLTPERASFSVSEPSFLDWRAELTGLDGLAAIRPLGATLHGPGEPRSISVAAISHDLLDVLGIAPEVGRMARADEDLPAAPAAVALISDDMWRSELAADPQVLGSFLDLNGRRYEVIGVMPPAVELVAPYASVFVLLGADPTMDRQEHYLDVVGRLGDGVDLPTAEQQLQDVQARLGVIHSAHEGWSARLRSADDALIGASTIRAGWILLTAAGLLLLMACVNVANLLVVRATARRVEMRLRSAIGAGRGRLVRQLLTESALLAAGGSVLGLAFARFALPAVRAMGDARIPRLETAQLDATAVLACLIGVGVAVVACGLAPVVQLRSSVKPASALRSSDPGSRLRSVLVGAQVAISVVLLAGTGLLLRSFVELTSIDPGFEPEGTLAVRIAMPNGPYTWESRAQLFPTIREAVGSLPGVVEVGATSVDPFSGASLANFIARLDRMPDRAADFTPMAWRAVTPGFFEAMGMDVVAGRTFTSSDGTDGSEGGGLGPVVIGRGLADALFDAGESPIGQTLVWGDPQGSRLLVIGVVEDLRDVALDEETGPIVYRPYREIPWADMVLVARVDGDPFIVAAGMRARIADAAPGIPVPEIRSLESNVRAAVAEPRFNLQILAAFAALGLLMAVVGVYGLTAFDVRRRYREIGIRISLGAEPESVRRMILRQRMTATTIGVAVGLGAAWWLVRGIEGQLYGVTAADPLTWIGVIAVIGVTAALATYLPARRATEVDPREVLSVE